MAPLVANAPATCNCLNGICHGAANATANVSANTTANATTNATTNATCTCNPGWTKAANGTACARCAPGFYLTSTGDCQSKIYYLYFFLPSDYSHQYVKLDALIAQMVREIAICAMTLSP